MEICMLRASYMPIDAFSYNMYYLIWVWHYQTKLTATYNSIRKYPTVYNNSNNLIYSLNRCHRLNLIYHNPYHIMLICLPAFIIIFICLRGNIKSLHRFINNWIKCWQIKRADKCFACCEILLSKVTVKVSNIFALKSNQHKVSTRR